MSACSMASGFVAKLMANSRSRIAHWQCTKTQKVRDGRPLLGAQRTGRRLLRRLGHGLPLTILDERRSILMPLRVVHHRKWQNEPKFNFKQDRKSTRLNSSHLGI